MNKLDRLEIWTEDGPMVGLGSSVVPAVGKMIKIRGEKWWVVEVSHEIYQTATDYGWDIQMRTIALVRQEKENNE